MATKVSFYYGDDTLIETVVSGPAMAVGAVYDSLTGNDDVAKPVQRIVVDPNPDISAFFGTPFSDKLSVSVQYREAATGEFGPSVASDDLEGEELELVEKLVRHVSALHVPEGFVASQVIIDLPNGEEVEDEDEDEDEPAS